jgi:hypothetical protein
VTRNEAEPRRIDESADDYTARMTLNIIRRLVEGSRPEQTHLESTGVTFDEDMRPWVEQTAAQRREDEVA